jgi:tRNA nucleotidyltransferase (CCA-adding enzyme)
VVYLLAVLTHDLGKAVTTTHALKDGVVRVVSPRHEEASGELATVFLERINAPLAIRERVIPLVVNHMAHFAEVTDRAVRRLAKRLEPENIEGLLTVMTADACGRPPLPSTVPAAVGSIAAKAEQLAVRAKPPDAILLGRHLLACGFKPGKELGEVLKQGYEAQLAGEFEDLKTGLRWLVDCERLDLPPAVRAAIKSQLFQTEE